MKILDTAIGEIGTVNDLSEFFMDSDKAIRFHCYLGAGDTIVVEGKIDSADTYQVLHTFDVDNAAPIDIYPSPIIRARRTVAGAGNSTVNAVGSKNYILKPHE